MQLLTLGGGNDYAFSDGMAFLQTYAQKKPLVINIDAHLDVRDLSRGPTSGTPFFRLLESKIDFDFVELGIQSQCNSTKHWHYVEEKGGKIISLDEILDSGLPASGLHRASFGRSLAAQTPGFSGAGYRLLRVALRHWQQRRWPIGLIRKACGPCCNF